MKRDSANLKAAADTWRVNNWQSYATLDPTSLSDAMHMEAVS